MKKEIGFIGLGKMGKPMVWRLRRKRWNVFTFDTKVRGNAGSLPELVKKTVPPRIIWLMIPAGKLVDQVLRSLTPLLNKGDVVIDGGNSFFKDSAKRAAVLKRKGIFYLDVGISGGPISIKQGRFAVMVGGEKRIYEKTRPLFRALSDTRSGYMGKSGAGHFAKMVHNGIEYGMLQSLAEGFALLTNWLQEGFERYGEDLARVSGTVAHTGEGEWTLKTARELGIATPVIKEALDFRIKSKKSPSFTGKILSTLRAVFGGHSVNPNEKR